MNNIASLVRVLDLILVTLFCDTMASTLLVCHLTLKKRDLIEPVPALINYVFN